MATYGRTFTLSNSNQTGLGSLALGAGNAGLVFKKIKNKIKLIFIFYDLKLTGEMGFLSYYEICQNLAKNNWTYVYNVEQQAPYAYFGNQWVGFDDITSLKIKSQYIISKNLGGAMVWVNLLSFILFVSWRFS